MAKILISSLGAGNKSYGEYKKAMYEIEGKQFSTSLISNALDQHINFDKVFLVGTSKSIWDEAYIIFGGEDSNYHEELFEKKELGLIDSQILSKFSENLKSNIKSYLIDYGLNNDEIWQNFEIFLEIANEIEDGDELYLDITNSFRSLSLMSYVMTQFASSISDKKFTINGLYYGMFEYSYENNGITPIVDIKILLEIQEWIKAIDAIKKYSDFDPLVRLLDKEKEIEDDVKKTFIQLNNTIEIANLYALKIFISTAAKKINTIENSSNKIIKLLAPEVIKLVNELNCEKDSLFQFTLAKWFFRNKNFAFSYIALYESIITKSCELKSFDVHEHALREEAKTSIGDDKYGKYFYTKRDNPKFKDSISNIRNSIVHQNLERKNLVKEDINRLENFLNTFETYINIGN